MTAVTQLNTTVVRKNMLGLTLFSMMSALTLALIPDAYLGGYTLGMVLGLAAVPPKESKPWWVDILCMIPFGVGLACLHFVTKTEPYLKQDSAFDIATLSWIACVLGHIAAGHLVGRLIDAKPKRPEVAA